MVPNVVPSISMAVILVPSLSVRLKTHEGRAIALEISCHRVRDILLAFRLYGFGEVVLTNDASKFRPASRRCSTAGSRGLHPSRNVAEPGGLQRWRAY